MPSEATRAKELAGLLRAEVEFVKGDAAAWGADTYGDLPRTAALLNEAASLIERLYRDKERLDFLDRLNSTLNAHYGTNYHWRLITNHNVNRLMIGHMAVDLNDAEANGLPSCREAIDARMVDFAPRALAGHHGQTGGAQG